MAEIRIICTWCSAWVKKTEPDQKFCRRCTKRRNAERNVLPAKRQGKILQWPDKKETA